MLAGSFVDGVWVTAGVPHTLINPATEDAFHQVAEADASVVDAAVMGAHQAWVRGWRDLPPGRRSALLHGLAASIEAHAEELAALDSRSMGKPLAAARGEVMAGAQTFRYYAGALLLPVGETIPVSRGGLDFTIRQPLGVVGCIVPWNFPFSIACWKVAPALAAGNAVVLKPAGASPLGALRLGELALAAGLPAGVLQVVCGAGAAVGQALVSHPGVRKISFTGSTAVGRQVMQAAAGDFKRLSLELGGKSPNIIFADSDWEKAADTAPGSVFDNTGQDCCARSRVFVEQSIYEPFLERFVAATRKLKVGAPDAPDTDLGPLFSAAQRDRVEGFLQAARGRRLCGGERPIARGYYLTPAILADTEVEEPCWQEEIFGPVACVRPFTDEANMLAEVNASLYGLSGSIWTRDLARALRVARQVEAGVLSINCHNSVHVEAPFGGWKHSGLGRDLGLAALHSFSEIKNIYVEE